MTAQKEVSPLVKLHAFARENGLPLDTKEHVIAAKEAMARATSPAGEDKSPRAERTPVEYATLIIWTDRPATLVGVGLGGARAGTPKHDNEEMAQLRILAAQEEDSDVRGVVLSVPSADLAGFPFAE